MKISIDRRACHCWAASCEVDFTYNFLGKEVKPTCCVLDIIEDEDEALTFYIKDRDGKDKVFVVTDENRADAIDSWVQAYEKQQAAQAGLIQIED